MALILPSTKGSPITCTEFEQNFKFLNMTVYTSASNPTTTSDGLEANRSLWLNYATKKWYYCTNATAGSVQWSEIEFETVPTGGTTGQVLTKVSDTAYDATWQDVPEGLPAGGTPGQVLAKASTDDYYATWEDVPEGLPAGGGQRYTLSKSSTDDYDATWEAPTMDLDGNIFSTHNNLGNTVSGSNTWNTLSVVYSTLSNLHGCWVVGFTHDLSDSNGCAISGGSATVAHSSQCVVRGTGNTVIFASASAVYGHDHVVGNDDQNPYAYKELRGEYLKATNVANARKPQWFLGQYNLEKDNLVITYGVGTADDARANAYEVFDTGLVLSPTLTPAQIEAGGDKALTTKEYVDRAMRSVSTNTAATNREIIGVDTTAGDVTVTLPPPSPNLWVTVGKFDGSVNTLTIAPNGSETINGDPTKSINTQYGSMTIYSDGTNYYAEKGTVA